MNKTDKIRLVTGLDLGQTSDFTALAVDEQRVAPAKPKEAPAIAHAIRHAQRFPLGTSYVDIVEAVKALFERPPLTGSLLVIDRTGVGRGIYDLFTRSKIKAKVSGLTITAGKEPGKGTVPKADLVAAVKAASVMGRLSIAPELEFAEVLAGELRVFQAKVMPTRHEKFEARDGEHDDIVLAAAMAIWTGERLGLPAGNFCPQYAQPGRPAGPIPIKSAGANPAPTGTPIAVFPISLG